MSKISIYLDMLKQSGTYGFASVVRRLSGIVLITIFTRYLTPADYAILDLLDLLTNLITLFFGLRLGDSFLYYYFKAPDDPGRQEILSTAMLGAVATGLIDMALCWIFTPQLSNFILGPGPYHGYVRLCAVQIAFLFPIEMGYCYIRALNKARLYMVLSTLRLVMGSSLVVILMVGFGGRVDAFLWGNAVASGLNAAYLIWYCLKSAKLTFKPALLWAQFTYGLPLALHSGCMMVIHLGDRYFLRRSVSLAEIGIYAVAYKIAMLVSFVHTPFELYWRSQVFTLMKNKNADEFYVQTYTYFTLVMTTVGLVVVLFLDLIAKVIVGDAFTGVAVYVPLLTGAYVLRALGDHLRTVLRTEKRTALEAPVTIVSAAICLLAYALLIPSFGVWGAVIGTLVAFSVMLVLSYRTAQRVKHYRFEYARWAQIVLSATAAAALFMWWKPNALIPSTLLGAAVLVAYASSFWFTRFFTPSEMIAIREIAGRLGRRASGVVRPG